MRKFIFDQGVLVPRDEPTTVHEAIVETETHPKAHKAKLIAAAISGTTVQAFNIALATDGIEGKSTLLAALAGYTLALPIARRLTWNSSFEKYHSRINPSNIIESWNVPDAGPRKTIGLLAAVSIAIGAVPALIDYARQPDRPQINCVAPLPSVPMAK